MHFGAFVCVPVLKNEAVLHPPADSHRASAESHLLDWGGTGWGGCGSLGCVPVFMHSSGSLADIQDDQVVEAVSRDKKRELPLEQILALTEETFHAALLGTARTVVLFYASCEYEIWPGCPFSKLVLLTTLSIIR